MLTTPRPAGGAVTLGEALATATGTQPGTPTAGSPLRLSFAGAESNVAIGLARLGHAATWIGRLGDDDPGRMVLRGLRGEGVTVPATRTAEPAPTAFMLKQQRTADRVFVTYYRTGSAGSRLDEGDVDPQSISSAAVLHVTGITPALGPGPRRAVQRALEVAREHATLISLDVNYRSALWSPRQAACVLGPLAAHADVVFAGSEELDLVTDAGSRTAQQRAADLRANGVREVVVKDGARGAWALHSEGLTRVAARHVTCVDPVGAGDAFAAGYLSALLDGLPVPDRLERGTLCGAACVSTRGDWEGLPHRGELAMLATADNVRR
ncbi:2-dehydro-3-deoxygluconokinase [Streptacidiphilus sp. BW17]|uniref:sugar kinase n=1 Tax=Streptacidiphilus sp. BW17 TaxID=3156274 RepID=UPI003518CB83